LAIQSLDAIFQPGLIERHAAVVEDGNLLRIDSQSDDVVTQLGQTCTEKKADIA